MSHLKPAGPATKSKKQLLLPCLLAFLALLCLTSGTIAQVIVNPATGHGYEYVRLRGFITWQTAVQEAQNRGGYLATITDTIEAGIVGQLLDNPGERAFLGASDFHPDCQWRWITYEPWMFENWAPEPSAEEPCVNYLVASGDLGGQWVAEAGPLDGFIVEWDSAPQDTLLNLIQWPVSQGGNGHWYAYLPWTLTWDQARLAAEQFERNGVVGHLATITSPEENSFIVEHLLVQDPNSPPEVGDWHWLGGYDDSSWVWVTNEPFIYMNWCWLDGIGRGSPQQQAASPILGIAINGPQPDLGLDCDEPGQWLFFPLDMLYGSIVEFDTEPVTDTIVNLLQWPLSQGGNDHWYAVIPQAVNWYRADSLAHGMEIGGAAGHLATVTSPGENQFILDHILVGIWPDTVIVFKTTYWLGGFLRNDGWRWVTGEPFEYSNWADSLIIGPGQEHVIAMFGHGWDVNPPLPGQWVSLPPRCDLTNLGCYSWAVIEFDTEIPYPPRTLLVPEDYPTIQSAINAAHNGDEVVVGPGVYHESINFMGKAIHVRSRRGPLATTITNYRTANLVTFDHGETRRAVLEGFTLRGGWMAILCVGSSPTIVRNLCVEQNVWNWSAIGLCGSFVYVNDPTGDPRYSARIGPAAAALVNNTIVHSANGGISSFSSVPPIIRNNIVAFNAHYGIHQQSLYDQPQPDIGYNDVFGHGPHTSGPQGNYINIPNPGPGAISADPMFNPDLTLRPESPCIDAGDPDPRFNDPDGTRNDMGAMFFQQEPGGGVIPTNEWIIVYCSGGVNEVPPLPGVMIRAFDPQGVLCGESVIRWDGSFGLMPIYRDDPYTDRDEGAEPGDLIHFKIGGQDATSNPPVFWTANGDVFEVCTFGYSRCVNIPLHEGWNLISWNVAFESPIRLALDEIIGCVEVVHSFEQGGLVFDPNLDSYNTLTHVDHHHGYWIRMRCDAVLQACGEDISPDQWIGLEAGWNLISYWPEMPFPVEEGFVTILDHLEEAMGFDHGAQVWLPGLGQLNTLTELRPRFGYWAKVNEPLPLTYPPFGGGLDPDDFRWSADSTWTSAALSETSRSWMSVYGSTITVDGVPLAEGTVVEFCTDETVVCGRGVYRNNTLRFTPVYGHDDSGEQSKRYPKEGDAIGVLVDGERVYPGLRWSSDGARVQLSRLTADSRGLPQSYVLKQNYPNPFNPGTLIGFEVPEDGTVDLSIYNVLGQRVRTLVDDQDYTVGRYELEWDGCDDSGARVSTGVYFYRLTAGDQSLTKKMLLLK